LADRGVAPGALIQVAQDAKPPFAVTASRPMCRYPQWPHYMGGPPKEGDELFVRRGKRLNYRAATSDGWIRRTQISSCYNSKYRM
jgi:hypothetical protein